MTVTVVESFGQSNAAVPFGLGCAVSVPVPLAAEVNWAAVGYCPERQIGLCEGEPLSARSSMQTVYQTREDNQEWTDRDNDND